MPAEVFHNYSMFNYKEVSQDKKYNIKQGLIHPPKPHPNETFPGLWLVISSRVSRTEQEPCTSLYILSPGLPEGPALV